MEEFIFPREAYLTRLGISSPPPATADGLKLLHRAQCFALAFENIEPFLSRPVNLDLRLLCEKTLSRGRGGYCFELNSIFLAALHAFGFHARPVLGRVFMGRPIAGPRTHQANLVEIGGRAWLADAGFGGPGLLEAIPFEAGYEGSQNGRKIRLRKDPDWGMLYEDEHEGKWRAIYAIPEEKVLPLDLVTGNHYCATHPDSIFRNSLYCALHAASGNVTVFNRSVNVFSLAGKEEKTLRGPADLHWLFRDLLRIAVSEEDVAALHAKLPLAEA